MVSVTKKWPEEILITNACFTDQGYRSPMICCRSRCRFACYLERTDLNIANRRCMYSKGNVSEKLRFSQLVQPGEVVVDLFAGSGYFTVPALKLSSNVKLLHACEWNPDAVQALRRNLKANGVESRCVVHPGDCRRLALIGEERAHRVSLGLIPDSKVGGETAVMCLREEGGWLHVHGNANEKDVVAFGESTASSIRDLCHYLRGVDWDVACTHVQRVKSYAPRVLHLVADIKCGPSTMATPSRTFAASGRARKARSDTGQKIADALRTAADQILCASPISTLTVDEARSLAADGQLLFKRVGDETRPS